MELCESCLAELSEKIKWESKMIAEQAQVFIPLGPSAKQRQEILSARLGQTELLSQLTEECGELIQAAQKLRRVLVKTTKVTKDQAQRNLIEEAADVALILDMLIRCKLLDRNGLQYIGRYKADRWYQRILHPGAADMDCVYLDAHENYEDRPC